MTKRPIIFILKNADETVALGRALGEMMEAGDTLALTGDLGAGKTTLTRGIARGLGVDEGYYITSPTFTLINEYPARIPLYHIDLYRLEGGIDADALGLEEYLESDGAAVVEWAERIGEENLPRTTVWMAIEFIDADGRRITATAPTEEAGRRLETWLNNRNARLFMQGDD